MRAFFFILDQLIIQVELFHPSKCVVNELMQSSNSYKVNSYSLVVTKVTVCEMHIWQKCLHREYLSKTSALWLWKVSLTVIISRFNSFSLIVSCVCVRSHIYLLQERKMYQKQVWYFNSVLCYANSAHNLYTRFTWVSGYLPSVRP